MSMNNISKDLLLKEITLAFPLLDMPLKNELTIHSDDCEECANLQYDLEEFRGKKNSDKLIRLVHQELSNLSVKAFLWILPHFLIYSINSKAEKPRMEMEFLVYYLSPSVECHDVMIQRFSFISIIQLNCLIHFLDWCLIHPYWKEYFPNDINEAKHFLYMVQRSKDNKQI